MNEKEIESVIVIETVIEAKEKEAIGIEVSKKIVIEMKKTEIVIENVGGKEATVGEGAIKGENLIFCWKIDWYAFVY